MPTKEEQFAGQIFELIEIRNEQAELLKEIQQKLNMITRRGAQADRIIARAEKLSPYPWSVHEAADDAEILPITDLDSAYAALEPDASFKAIPENRIEPALGKVIKYLRDRSREYSHEYSDE